MEISEGFGVFIIIGYLWLYYLTSSIVIIKIPSLFLMVKKIKRNEVNNLRAVEYNSYCNFKQNQ